MPVIDLERIRGEARQEREFELERLTDRGLHRDIELEIHGGRRLAGRHGVRHLLVFGRTDGRSRRRRASGLRTLSRSRLRRRGDRVLLAFATTGQHDGERDDGGATGGKPERMTFLHGSISQPVMLTVMQVRPRRSTAELSM